MKVSIIIATFGADAWRELALNRAYPSALDQGAHEIMVGHDPEGTLASVRNFLARKAEGEWLCFLDGDDELAPGYLNAMKQVRQDSEDPILYAPSVSYVSTIGRREEPKFWPECSLTTGNWLVIGTLVPRDLFLEVGGFEEWEIYEDWALFARCWKAGAQVVKVPEAVYLAHRKRGLTRNHALKRRDVLRIYAEIQQAVFG